MRATIQRHSSSTRSYQGAKDIFYSVYGIGEGYWGLNKYKEKLNNMNVKPIEQRKIDLIKKDDTLTETERESIILSRIGQGKFREKIINKYKSCIITGISDTRVLLASHIKPWRNSDNNERLSSENGLLLSPLYDKLFDIGLISFKPNGSILISNNLNPVDRDIIKINENCIYLKEMLYELKQNMQYHNDIIFLK